MKIFKTILFTALLFVLASCGGSGYNAAKCEELAQKIANREQLTDQDYSEMIDQVQAIAKIMDKDSKKYGDDSAMKKEIENNPEYKEMASYAIGFVFVLSMNEKELSEENKAKLNKAEKDVKDL